MAFEDAFEEILNPLESHPIRLKSASGRAAPLDSRCATWPCLQTAPRLSTLPHCVAPASPKAPPRRAPPHTSPPPKRSWRRCRARSSAPAFFSGLARAALALDPSGREEAAQALLLAAFAADADLVHFPLAGPLAAACSGGPSAAVEHAPGPPAPARGSCWPTWGRARGTARGRAGCWRGTWRRGGR